MNMLVKTVLNTIIVMLLIDCHKVLLSVFLKGERQIAKFWYLSWR